MSVVSERLGYWRCDRDSTYDWLRTETFKVGSRLSSEWIMTYEKRKLNIGDTVDELDWITK